MILRRRRIFAGLREGLSYDEIAAEEGVTRERVRQIVTEVLRKQAVDSGADHAKLQLARLAPVIQVAAEAVAAGDISAIGPYLKALDRIDRYQAVAGANQQYDEEAKRKLLDKINQLADNLGMDEVMWAAGREHLRKLGELRDKEEPPEGAEGRTDQAEETGEGEPPGVPDSPRAAIRGAAADRPSAASAEAWIAAQTSLPARRPAAPEMTARRSRPDP